jgi:hypothetical protein
MRRTTKDPVELFLKIVKMVSKNRLRLNQNSRIADLFKDPAVFGPLEYELCLYSLEASMRRKIDGSFYKGGVEKDFETTIADFIAQYLRREISDDPLFVARQFNKFAQSAKREADEQAEPGKN